MQTHAKKYLPQYWNRPWEAAPAPVPRSTPTHRCQDVTHTHRQRTRDSREGGGKTKAVWITQLRSTKRAFSRYHLCILECDIKCDFHFYILSHGINNKAMVYTVYLLIIVFSMIWYHVCVYRNCYVPFTHFGFVGSTGRVQWNKWVDSVYFASQWVIHIYLLSLAWGVPSSKVRKRGYRV